MTPGIDELDLNAYLDGELDDGARKRLELALADDPPARQRLSGLREQDAIVRAAMSEPLNQPVPDDVHQRVETMFAQAKKTQTQWGDTRPGRIPYIPLAIAASIVMAFAGVLAAFMMLEQRVDQRLAQLENAGRADQAYYDNALSAALEDHVSGETVAWINPDTGASGLITPVRTFKSATDDWCREFNTVASQDDASEIQNGIACRTGDGVWQTRVLVFGSPGTISPDL